MKAKLIYFTVGLVAVLLSINVYSSGGPIFLFNWYSLQIGDTKQTALLKLGEPFKESNEFDFWDMKYKDDAKSAGSITYLTWDKNIDSVFVIGFDENQLITYKVTGGS